MDITVKKSRRRTISLSVAAGGLVVLRVPHWLRARDIEKIIERKSSWIVKNVNRMRAIAPKKYQFVSGESFMFLGQAYVLMVSERYFRGVQLVEGRLEISRFHQARARSLVLEWYKKQAKQYLVSRLDAIARQRGTVYASLRITSPKTRWGSCSGKGTINLSWKLIMLDSWIIDYVIVHELTHLTHHHHQRSFWVAVSCSFPQWKEARDWLKNNGNKLPAI